MFGTKADLTDCLEKLCTSKGEAPVIDVIILDGAAIINMLKPVGAKTFQDYAMLVFFPYVKARLSRVTRVDIIWDVNIPDSLKSTARENRGKGVRRRVAAANSIPGNWQEFLRVDENKTELFNFLAHEVVENLSTEKEVFSTCGKHVLCSRVHQDVSAMAPCSHEKADTRMFIARQGCGRKRSSADHAANSGYRRCRPGCLHIVSMENTQLWIAFGTGKHLRYIPSHEIATSLGAEKAQALPMFHAFTGCDTVSSFAGKGKKTAFDTWRSFNAATEVFARLVTRPTSLDNICMYSSHTWCLCMIGGVTKLLWTQPGSTCSRQKPDLSAPFHQPELHCCSMQDEQNTRVAMYGVRPRSEIQTFLLQSPGDGARIRREDGNRCGRYSQKRPCPAQSC